MGIFPDTTVEQHRRFIDGRLRVFSALVLPFVLLLGCAGAAPFVPTPFDRSERIFELFDRAADAGDTARMAALFSYAHEHALWDDDTLLGRYAELLERVESELSGARDAGEYGAAIRAVESLRTLYADPLRLEIDRPAVEVPNTDRLRLSWVESLLVDEAVVPALEVLREVDNLETVNSDTLIEYLTHARRVNNDALIERLSRELAARGVQSPQPATELEQVEDRPVQMLSGTVTIWVNRGIRIRGGVGVPDRVIGSGFFIDPRGYLITNYHVVESEVDPAYEGYSRLFVKLPGRNDQRVPARVVGYDRIFDLALLKVEIDPQYVFSFSDVRRLRPGQTVFALGSPGGLDSTITSGIVSADGRRFLQMGEAMQVDAAINPGNSGGPLVLPTGQVAGVVFAGIEQFEGVNFAVPAHWVRYALPALFGGGAVRHGWIGVALRTHEQGLEVIYVAPDTPAAVAGVRRGDILVALDGRPTTDMAGAHDIVLSLDPGHIVAADFLVAGSPRARLLGLAERPFSPVEEALKREPIEALFPVLFGMEVDLARGAFWTSQYVITQVYPGGIADESSLSIDDPFALRNWRVDSDLRAAFIQIIIKKRKAGFLETGVQLGSYLDVDNFL